MYFKPASRKAGRSIATLAALLAGALGGTASAETIFTVNGMPVDSAVVDVYFESRLGQPGAQPTPEQRTILIGELRDIYLLATQESAEALLSDPELAARIELQRLGAIAQAVAGEFYSSVEITEDELRAEYDNQIAATPPLQFKARHILVATQGEATDLIAELDGGADFAELAREKSTGPTGPNGGDLDWFSPNQMVPEFSVAVEALEDGSYTAQPIQTQFGWHVILREDSRESTPPTFESVRASLNTQVQQQKFEAHLETLRSAAAEE